MATEGTTPIDPKANAKGYVHMDEATLDAKITTAIAAANQPMVDAMTNLTKMFATMMEQKAVTPPASNRPSAQPGLDGALVKIVKVGNWQWIGTFANAADAANYTKATPVKPGEKILEIIRGTGPKNQRVGGMTNELPGGGGFVGKHTPKNPFQGAAWHINNSNSDLRDIFTKAGVVVAE
jgi:hypothetical protein